MATLAATEATAPPKLDTAGPILSISYLRAFVTLLVVVVHSTMVYMSIKIPRSSSFAVRPRIWMLFPVADPAGWPGFDLYFAWFDHFAMPLMFLISGLFVWPGLMRHGGATFLARRLLRVGLPFAVSGAVLGPLMYYPAYLQSGADPGFSGYAKAWLTLGSWPSGSAWFLWLLLSFDCLALLFFMTIPRAVGSFGNLLGSLGERPFFFFLALIALAQAAYLPMFWKFGPWGQVMYGPFIGQGTKFPLYFLYFFVGVGVGIYGLNAGLLDRAGRLARRWPLWGIGSLLLFGAWLGSYIAKKDQMAAVLFSFSCAATSLFITGLFVRFAKRSRIADNFSANAYGIYLLHYVIVCWVQWMLLRIAAPAILKGFAAFVCTLAVSWTASYLLRRSSAIARVI